MKAKLTLPLYLLLMGIGSAFGIGTINWSSEATGGLLVLRDSTMTTLAGSVTEGSSGMLQLLYLGPNGVYDDLGAFGTSGVLVDDEVVAVSWVGEGFIMAMAGRFSATVNPATNGNYAIRLFSSPNPTPGSGTASFIPSNGFVNHVTTGNVGGAAASFVNANVLGSDIATFEVQEFLDTTIVIPEPSSLAFLATGLAVFAVGRRVRKRTSARS